MWPDVKSAYPDAELWVTYGFDTFIQLSGNNPERMSWMRSVEALLKQPGITHYGRVGKEKLGELRKQCGIIAYPTHFLEINCISMLEAQRDGLVPVTMSLGALQETVGSGVKLTGDIKTPEIQKKYLDALLDMMSDKEKWEKESHKAKKFTNKYDWVTIAGEWVKIFTRP
jgi:glycosyltransferase involved in cell wall biosynthesis